MTAVTSSREPHRILQNQMIREFLILFPGTMPVVFQIQPAHGRGCGKMRAAKRLRDFSISYRILADPSMSRGPLVRFHWCAAACGGYERGAYDRRS